jgi:formylglycine-generating enzyme required for sulfatase activity
VIAPTGNAKEHAMKPPARPTHAVRRLRLAAPLAVALAALLAGLPSPAQPAGGKKYALLVGVTEYESAHFARLKYTENDVEGLARLLARPGAGFASVRVLTTARGKKDARDAPTAANIRKALDALLEGRGKHDLVLLALSGHGIRLEVKEPEGEKEPKSYGYFCPADARLTGVKYTTGFSRHLLHVNDTFEAIGKCDAGTKLVLVDACRNELAVKADTRSAGLGRVTVPDGVGALFSCKPGQRAFETAGLGKGHGVFFYHVLQGLRGEAKNGRGEVTWSRLADYVSEAVPEEVERTIRGGARQEPHLIANLAGRSPVLARAGAEAARQPLVNGIGMRLVPIPAGKFTMGSPKGEAGRKVDEGPQHEVAVSGFYLGAYEVTQAQFHQVMGYNPSHFSLKAKGKEGVTYRDEPGGGKAKVSGQKTESFPVENVSYDEAAEFCRRLTELDTKKPGGHEYRLPTEAEWEYACRGGAASYQVFHFGNSLSSTQANFDGNSPYGGASKGPYLGRTTAVGSYKPNAFGLYDLHGNVWEWCLDWNDFGYYAKSPAADPRGPAEGRYRVLRGGSWDCKGGKPCRSANRAGLLPGRRLCDLGFRVALVPSGK